MLPELQLAILDLNARYSQAIDDNRLEVWPGFFTESARYIVTTAENLDRGLPLGMIYATSRAMLQDRVRSLREANIYESQRYRHVVGVPLLESAQDGAAPGFVQRGAKAAHEMLSVVEMGGSGIASGQSKVSEAAVRGMWHAWRQHMGL